jgi:hypothetical protein
MSLSIYVKVSFAISPYAVRLFPMILQRSSIIDHQVKPYDFELVVETLAIVFYA